MIYKIRYSRIRSYTWILSFDEKRSKKESNDVFYFIKELESIGPRSSSTHKVGDSIYYSKGARLNGNSNYQFTEMPQEDYPEYYL